MDNWEWSIEMLYERVYKCHTYKYIIRKNKRTVYNKEYFKYDEERIDKILQRLKRDERLKKIIK
jgi:hypothetical protein